MNPQPCNKCQCVIKWDMQLKPPAKSPRAKEGKAGWWVEDLSKEPHTQSRCEKFQSTGEFQSTDEKIEHAADSKGTQMIKKELLEDEPLVKTETSEIPVHSLDAADFAVIKIRGEAKTNLKILTLIDEEITNYYKHNKWELNGQKMGLWMKLLLDMSKIIGKNG